MKTETQIFDSVNNPNNPFIIQNDAETSTN